MTDERTDRERMRALVKEFHSGMLVTRAPEGTMHARPMALAKLADDDDLFFATSIESGKVSEIEHDHHAAVTFQSTGAYVSISGPARIVTDRAQIRACWSETMKVWFPKGPDDPSLCLLQLRPVHAEYWNTEGIKGLRYVYEAAKAYVKGRQPVVVPGQHGEVDGPAIR